MLSLLRLFDLKLNNMLIVSLYYFSIIDRSLKLILDFITSNKLLYILFILKKKASSLAFSSLGYINLADFLILKKNLYTIIIKFNSYNKLKHVIY